MTDMGRIYIILGPPRSIERFDGTAGHLTLPGLVLLRGRGQELPDDFGLVFFQRGGPANSSSTIPSPTGRGASSSRPEDLDLTDYAAVYEKIMELAPTLAGLPYPSSPAKSPTVTCRPPEQLHPGQTSSNRRKRTSTPLRHPFPELQGHRQHGIHDELHREHAP